MKKDSPRNWPINPPFGHPPLFGYPLLCSFSLRAVFRVHKMMGDQRKNACVAESLTESHPPPVFPAPLNQNAGQRLMDIKHRHLVSSLSHFPFRVFILLNGSEAGIRFASHRSVGIIPPINVITCDFVQVGPGQKVFKLEAGVSRRVLS